MNTTEFAEKRRRIDEFLDTHQLNGLLLVRSSSWSWASCGREANIAANSETAFGALLFTRERQYLLADRIELPRLLAEEVGDLPFEPVEYPWHTKQRRDKLAMQLAGGPLGADVLIDGAAFLAGEIGRMRIDLTPAEQERFRNLGQRAGAAVEAAARSITPGMSELELAGVLALETFRRGAVPVVTLIATDDRVRRFRHPAATAKTLDRYAMLVLCARQCGLVASATRLVHFGPLPDDLRDRAIACARIDAAVHAATRPGATLGAVFAALQAAYAAAGFPDEWLDHHQGGVAGYENRELLGLPQSPFVVCAGQAYAWNPSIAGVKSEDTILVTKDSHEVLTATGQWPSIPVEIGGRTVHRPAILER
jgi:antitoxin VapB